MEKQRMHGIRAAARATRLADYCVEHVQIEYDPKADTVSAYYPGPYGYFEPDNDRNIIIHIFAPATLKQLREQLREKIERCFKD